MRHVSLAIATLIALLSHANLGPAGEQAAVPNPDIPPELEKPLADWERSLSAIRTYRADFEQVEKDDLFKTEKQSTGTIYYEAPDKGRLELQSQDSTKIWIWTGDGCTLINESERTFQKLDADSSWTPKPQAFLPLVFDVLPASVFTRPPNVSARARPDGQVHVSFDESDGPTLHVLVDRTTLQTVAIKHVFADWETRTLLKNIEVNQPLPAEKFPGDPDLTGYRDFDAQPPVSNKPRLPLFLRRHPIAPVVQVMAIASARLCLPAQPLLRLTHKLLLLGQ